MEHIKRPVLPDVIFVINRYMHLRGCIKSLRHAARANGISISFTQEVTSLTSIYMTTSLTLSLLFPKDPPEEYKDRVTDLLTDAYWHGL